ncbi:signal peptidase II [Candidatus Gracilibacteria bacterium]|nr:signal peptidase II [Candidatus Gracilibacteria bacterium]
MRKYTFLVFLVLFDFLSKQYFVSILSDGKTISLFKDIFSLKLAYNRGVAFSLPISGLFLQILTILIIGFLGKHFYQVEYPKKSRLLDFGYMLIFSGAISHAYERIFHGQVVDFIAVKYFAILNFADIFISIGAFLIFCAYVIHRKHR